jgi:hypothetical protein
VKRTQTSYVVLIGRRILMRKPGEAAPRQLDTIPEKIEQATYETTWYRQLWLNTAIAQFGEKHGVAVLQLLQGGKV